MRKFITLLYFCACFVARGQTWNYSYWFDANDKEQYTGTSLGNNLQVDISTDGLSAWFHTLHFQLTDEEGNSSPVLTHTFAIVPQSTADRTPATYRYWFDSDEANMKTGAMTGNNFMADISIEGLSSWYHLLHYQVQDVSGQWSPVLTRTFAIIPQETIGNRDLTGQPYRYWFDDDDANMQTGTLSSNVLELEAFTGQLSSGVHYFHLQVCDDQGNWSSVLSQKFLGGDQPGVILPWGSEWAWESKYIFTEGRSNYTDPTEDANGHQWTELGYDDSAWQTLTGPMANSSDRFDEVNYIWEGDDNCFNLRRVFTMDSIPEGKYQLLMAHDDGVKVYLNGQLVVDDNTYGMSYTYDIPQSTFVVGENILAIYVEEKKGDQYLDYCLRWMAPEKVEKVTLNLSDLTLAGGEFERLSANVVPSAASDRIVWSVTDPEIARVNSKGVVTALMSGTTTIVACSKDDSSVRAECAITVTSDFHLLVPWGSDEPWEANYRYWNSTSDYQEPEPDGAGLTWTEMGYDDSNWQTLTGPMANNMERVNYKYSWTQDHSCFTLRRVIHLDKNPTGFLRFCMKHDDDTRVYMNGQLMIEAPDYTYDEIAHYTLPASAMKEGDNMLAMYIQDTYGGWKFLDYTIGYRDSVPDDDMIVFADPVVKAICVENWDTSHDGELNKTEARAVTELGEVFRQNKEITSFEELQYFTGLTAIPESGFERCTELAHVILPSSIRSIGNRAFQGCSRIENLEIPEGVTNIGMYAFVECNLKSITIPKTVEAIGYAPFVSNRLLTTIIVDAENQYYDSRNNCNAIIQTGENALIQGCSETKIPDDIVSIGQAAFEFVGITNITLPNTLKTIGHTAFYECSLLESVTFPEGLETIGSYAFHGCKKLKEISIPASVTYVAPSAFMGCENIVYARVDAGNAIFDSREDCNAVIRTKENILYCGFQTSVIPASVTSLADECFRGQRNLTAIEIPELVSSIGNYAFEGCENLQSIKVHIQEPFEINSDVFYVSTTSLYENATLYVPVGTAGKYRDTPTWNQFKNIVEFGEIVPLSTFDGLVLTVRDTLSFDDIVDKLGGFEVLNNTIAAIVWEIDRPYNNSVIFTNPNLLVYVNDAQYAPTNINNVVIGDFAKSIVLTDVESGNNNFYCPQAFKAESIRYTREFKQQTQVGVSRGWETIALPFTVQSITHADKGAIAPFGVETSDRHFWLRQLTQQGLARATQIEANTPYIISMPNSDEYTADYNLNGQVTFSAVNVTVPVTAPETLALADNTIMMASAFQSIRKSSDVWALNVGEARSQYFEGSTFERDYREVRPFEAYTIHEGGQGPAPRFIPIVDMSNGATNIEKVANSQQPIANGMYYDLSGRKLQQKPSQKGVYLHRGRKVVIR